MKKKSIVPGILVILLGIAGFALIFMYIYADSKNNKQYFNPNKKSVAERLYNSVMDRDLLADYPQSPEQVMEFNLDVVLLLYGNMIVEHELFPGIISQQRLLFSQALAQTSTPEEQLAGLILTVDTFKENGISCYRLSQLPAIFNPFDTNICYIRVEQLFNTGEKLYWQYDLEKSTVADRWEITRWEATDSQYNPLAQSGQ